MVGLPGYCFEGANVEPCGVTGCLVMFSIGHFLVGKGIKI